MAGGGSANLNFDGRITPATEEQYQGWPGLRADSGSIVANLENLGRADPFSGGVRWVLDETALAAAGDVAAAKTCCQLVPPAAIVPEASVLAPVMGTLRSIGRLAKL